MSRANLTGCTFGRLLVQEFSHADNHRTAYWVCVCCCGNTITARGSSLKSGHTKSCGCYHKDRVKTHALAKHAEYKVWASMMSRCTCTKHRQYSHYGGRGITVCDRWKAVENFYADMGPRPSKDHSIDRIDNDGPYCKDNCRWATVKQQNNNTRANRVVSYNGKTMTAAQWADVTGINVNTLRSRLDHGWSIQDALTIPVKPRNKR